MISNLNAIVFIYLISIYSIISIYFSHYSIILIQYHYLILYFPFSDTPVLTFLKVGSCDFPRGLWIFGFLLARLKKELKWFSTEITSTLLDYIRSALDKQEPD